jgi:hypothetical protein
VGDATGYPTEFSSFDVRSLLTGETRTGKPLQYQPASQFFNQLWSSRIAVRCWPILLVLVDLLDGLRLLRKPRQLPAIP